MSAVCSFVAAALLFTTGDSAGYELSKEWKGSTFFEGWTWETKDYTGHTNYGHYTDLAYHDPKTDSAIIKVAGDGGRSIKLRSYQSFNEGLFLLDTNHIPWGCSVWPAFWTVGSGWPAAGEIDIIENVNNEKHTDHTLHTSSGCDYSSANTNGQFTGSWGTSKNCNAGNAGTGCGIKAADGTHGEPWSTAGGGVHVMLWDRNKGISIWDIQRKSVPSWMNKNTQSISDSHLQELGTPVAHFGFGSHCSANHFHDHHIILNIAVCGGWPDGVWGSSGCGSWSCESWVSSHKNSGAFDNAYFDINYLKVFKYSGSGPGPSPPGPSPPGPSPPAPSPGCGYVPSDCKGDINWALKYGRWSNPGYYPDFQSVTGWALNSANYDDMVLYFHCKNVRPEGRCEGIQKPCDTSCGNSALTPLSPLMDPVDGGYGSTDHFVVNPYDVILVLCLVLVVLCAINLCVTIRQRQRASYMMKM